MCLALRELDIKLLTLAFLLHLLPALPDFLRFPELVPRERQMHGEAISLSLVAH